MVAKRAAETEEDMPDLVLRLEAPIEVEGERIEKIDMNGLYDLTLMDLSEVDREYARLTGKSVTAAVQVDRLYAALTAAKANHKPYEWLMGVKLRDSNRLSTMVYTFFYMRV